MKDTPQILGGRFQLIRLLKEDLGIATYLAVDQTAGKRAVVKAARIGAVPSPAELRLRQEGDVLQALSSPAIPGLLANGAEDDWLWLAMPRIDGPTLQERLAEGRLSVDETIALGRRLTEGLASIHARGILHLDVKPANIIVQKNRPEQAVLIDFGFARSQTGGADGEAVGTALYVSPEGAGLLDSGVDERSDAYSLGIVLYEALAGKPPFTGRSVNEILGKHLSEEPAEIRTPERVPRALGQILRRLLAKDPRDRYRSPEGLLTDLEALATARAAGEPDPALVIGASERRDALTEPSFIERGTELSLLASALDDARRGAGGLVLLEGFSGLGKTRLLSEAARLAKESGALVVKGQGVDQSSKRPLQLLAGVIADLRLADAATRADLRVRLDATLAGQSASLLDSLPEAAALLAAAPRPLASGAPEAYGETRTIQACGTFLDTLGTSARPALVLLDDCQWADELTVRLIVHWSRLAAARHVLLVASFRTAEVPLDHPLRTAVTRRRLALADLKPAQVQALAESMAGPLPPEAVETITKLADGNPFMTSAILRGLVESGALRAGDAGWQIDEEAMKHAQSSRRAAAFLAQRLRLLSPRSRALLTAGAVLGKDFEVALAGSLAALGPADALATVSEARRRGIVWEDGSGARCRFVHDKLRETLLEELTVEQRRHWHGLAAQWLEAHAPERNFDLAYHFDAAGRADRALPYALAAAETARSRHALAIAEQQYSIAERGAAAAEAGVQARILQGFGEVLMLAGRYAEAQTRFEAARGLASAVAQRAAIETALGELAFKRGDMRSAALALERALHLLGRKSPHGTLQLLACMLWEAAVQASHTLFPRLILGGKKTPADADLRALRVYSRLAYAHWFKSGKLACGWAHLRNMNVAERFPETLELAQAYSEHGPVATMLPWFERGRKYVEKSLRIRERFGNIWGQGQSHAFLAVVHYGASRYRDCIAACTEATRLLETTGDRWESNTARWHKAYAYYRLGNLREAIETARQVFADAQAIGDHSSAGIALSVWSKASRGTVPVELLRAELARSFDDVHTRAELLQAEAVRRLAASDAAGAATVLRQALKIVGDAGLRQEYVAPILPWLATAERLLLEAEGPFAAVKGRQGLRAVARTARRAVRQSRAFRNNLPHALREEAFVLALRGKLKAARRRLTESYAEADRQGAALECVLTELARARIASAAGDAGAAAQLLKAQEAHTEMLAAARDHLPKDLALPERTPLSVVDRLETLLSVGPAIVTAVSRDAVYAALREAGGRLLRGQRCLVYRVLPDGASAPFELVAGDGDAGASMRLLREAVTRGRPAVADDEQPADPSESLLLSGVRSALCAPVRVRGRVAACLYVAHDRIGRLYRAEDLKVAEFIAALAGAALEIAESFTQMQILNDSLATQVNERRRAAEQLTAAHAAAEAANQAKSDFLANISHEIRTPLGSILGYADLMDGELSEEERRQFLAIIRRNGDQLLTLVNDILDLSKIEAGKLIVEKIPVRLEAEIASVVAALEPQARLKNLQLSLTVAPRTPTVVIADPVRLKQILLNIVSNAVKFTPQGRVDILVSWRPHPLKQGQPGLSISVDDTGIGLAPEQAAKLFQPFNQADPSTSRRFGGSGLGLALSRRLAGLLGGELFLERSAVDAGSTFTLWLGADAAQADGAVVGASSVDAGARKPAATARVLAGVRVLLVEDMPDIQRLASMVLKRAGALVDVAGTGRTALAAAQAGGFDLILLDIQLPELDGIEILRTLRAAGDDTPVVMLTAHGMLQERDLCFEIGCDDYVIKPVKPDDLPGVALRNLRMPGRAAAPAELNP